MKILAVLYYAFVLEISLAEPSPIKPYEACKPKHGYAMNEEDDKSDEGSDWHPSEDSSDGESGMYHDFT